uniref:Uncharacterized protein n=1 Tax=Aegilops tauschii subsp. strangulata TaxID=200361 RepID=A0A452XVS8_AEGTS
MSSFCVGRCGDRWGEKKGGRRPMGAEGQLRVSFGEARDREIGRREAGLTGNVGGSQPFTFQIWIEGDRTLPNTGGTRLPARRVQKKRV